MKAIIVESDPIRSDMLCRILADYNDTITVIKTFTGTDTLFDFLNKNHVDIIFLDISARIDGLKIGAQIRKQSYNIAIIYISSTPAHAVEAFKVYAQGYILKPFNPKDIYDAIDNAKHMLMFSKRITAVTFGNFDVFANGKVLHFSRTKSKELLALLIDRCGGEITLNDVIEIILNLSPNSMEARQLARKVVSTLKKDLEYYGILDICSFKYGVYAINPSVLDCDLYKLLEGNKDAAESFTGDYMLQYPWAKQSLPKIIASKELMI